MGDDNKKKVWKADFSVTDVNAELGIVFGWGMVTNISGQPYFDTDNQHFPDTMMVKATSDFMEGQRINNNDHTANDVGMVVHSFPLSKEIADAMGVHSNINGWMVGVKPGADSLAKFASGEYTGFSIEGSGELEDIEEE